MRVGISVALVSLIGCGGGGGGDDSAPGDGPEFASGTGPYFTTAMFWNRDVSASPKASNSDKQIAALRAAGGWGNGDTFQIDFSIDVLTATSSTPMKTFTKTGDFYDPDCDDVAMPIPDG